MRRRRKPLFSMFLVLMGLVLMVPGGISYAQPYCDDSNALSGGSLSPCDIPKYETPLVIPPVMANTGSADDYHIAVRQFKQQILPGGIWKDLGITEADMPPTTLWSYGPDADPTPVVAPDPGSQFNYPAYTIETISNSPVDVRWINDLVDEHGKYLPHLFHVDQTVHWANPLMDCADGTERTDCMGTDPEPYTGPVPIVTHVHGAHVYPHSDGYPEAWWLPAAKNIPKKYATEGTLFDDANGQSPGQNLGYVDFSYINNQPATTLWYHDHALGMTRLNVYAGPAGFWLIRGGAYDMPTIGSGPDAGDPAVLPGPAPVAGQTVLELNNPADPIRQGIREIPIVMQDRSFNDNGSLFYPKNREFFEGVRNGKLQIDFAADSDVLPIWNPEAFFNVMVVNGGSWPKLEVAQARYRFRLLNGCNSRFLNLALIELDGDGEPVDEIPFYQIGAEQGFLSQVVRIQTNEATPLPGNGTSPAPVNPASPDQALLMGLAERADVIVDFSGLADGTVVQMINTAPDAPFGGFGDDPADPATTGQVMQFVVNDDLNGQSPTDATATSPLNIVLNGEGPLGVADNAGNPRNVSLNEDESAEVCVLADETTEEFLVPIKQVACDSVPPEGTIIVSFGPTAALLGQVDLSGADPEGVPLKWTDAGGLTPVTKVVPLGDGSEALVTVTENPDLNAVEEWDIYNFTEDAHPIHLHLVRFEVVGRQGIDGGPSGVGNAPQPWESGFKDTVIAYPGEITTVKAKFDIEGLYVWHCHIVEHEDNEMMRPYAVGLADYTP